VVYYTWKNNPQKEGLLKWNFWRIVAKKKKIQSLEKEKNTVDRLAQRARTCEGGTNRHCLFFPEEKKSSDND